MAEKPLILVVDDEKLNLGLMEGMLVPKGYRVVTAQSGPSAIEKAHGISPDIILLDIIMPDMDGFETCRRLKESDRTRDIPVIFLSAIQDAETKAACLQMGGVDYITKPFEMLELLARVETHVILRRQADALSRYAIRLEQMVEERTQKLIHADRLATLGTFSAGIAHEINNPSMYIGWNLDMLKEFWKASRPVLERHGDEDISGEVKGTLPDVDRILQAMSEGVKRITRIVKGLKGYGRTRNEPKAAVSLSEPVADALDLLGFKVKGGIRVLIDIPREIAILCERQKITQVFVNLVSNAVDAMEGKGGEVAIAARMADGRIRVTVSDSGPGIPAEAATRIFDPFFTTKDSDKGTGLGLFIVRSIIEEHGGEIALAEPGGKATFVIHFPPAGRSAP